MLNRRAVLVVLFLALSAISASAQYTVADANGTVVGNVVGGRSDSDPFKALVTTQDANGIWVAMEMVQDGFVPVSETVMYYTDSACATTPYLLVSGVSVAFTPLFRRLSGLPNQLNATGYYPGNPVATQTFQSFAYLSNPSFCRPDNRPWMAGPLTVFDFTTFVPPFSVQPSAAPAPLSLSRQRR
jgi:hypothetical protein